jgi:predicted HTH domain antitoxin
MAIMVIRRWASMSMKVLTIPYSEDLLLSMKRSPQEFESEARLLLAVKLYELDRISTGAAAQLAGLSRVAFMFELSRFGLSSVGQQLCGLAEDLASA